MKSTRMIVTVLVVLSLAELCSAISPSRRTPVVTAVEKALPSVVNIGTEKLVQVVYSDPVRRYRGSRIDQLFTEFFGPPMPLSALGYQNKHSLGSGVMVSEDGYILTNYHVIERATKIQVTLSDSTSYEAHVVAGDEVSDLALIRIDVPVPVQAVELAADDDLLLGETVIVLGNPFGLGHTVTVGVLSAKDREAAYQGEVLYRDILQTDAAVNPGSSGGPLINVDGKLIGVNVVFYREAQNIGFAVPVKRVRTLLKTWLSPEYLNRLWIGFEVDQRDEGLFLSSIDSMGPATDRGFQPEDQLVSVNGELVEDRMHFYKILMGAVPGERADFEVKREEQHLFISHVLNYKPGPAGSELANVLFGLEIGEEPEAFIKALNFNKGLPITAVVEASPAGKAGLKPGLLVTRINNFEIRSLDDVGMALERIRPGDEVTMVITRIEGGSTFVRAQSATVKLTAE